MKPILYFALLALTASNFASKTCAQTPLETSIQPGSLTDGLISRAQLRSLSNAADSHHNPLRRPAPAPRPQPAPIPTPQPSFSHYHRHQGFTIRKSLPWLGSRK